MDDWKNLVWSLKRSDCQKRKDREGEFVNDKRHKRFSKPTARCHR